MTNKNINHTGSKAWLEEYKKYLGDYGDEEFQEYSKDIAYDLEKFNDPIIVGAMIHRLIEERKKTNALFQVILEELRAIRSILEKGEGKVPSTSVPITSKTEILSEVDEKIIAFVKEKGRATADEVQKALGYKGRNAASARLNRLYQLGFLEKKRAGRKVYYLIGGR